MRAKTPQGFRFERRPSSHPWALGLGPKDEEWCPEENSPMCQTVALFFDRWVKKNLAKTNRELSKPQNIFKKTRRSLCHFEAL